MEFGGPGPRGALDGRARDARQHGDRVHREGAASCEGDERDRRVDRRAPARRLEATTLRAPARDARPGRALRRRRARDRPRRRSSRWSRTPAIPTAASRPTRRTARSSASWATVTIDIAYGGSCTAGKGDDIDFYAEVMARGASRPAGASRRGVRVLHPVRLARTSRRYAKRKGYLDCSQRAGVEVIQPGCGACIGCGPGVSERGDAGHRLGDQPQLQGALGPRAGSTSRRPRPSPPRPSRAGSSRTRRACSASRRSPRGSAEAGPVRLRDPGGPVFVSSKGRHRRRRDGIARTRASIRAIMERP